MKSRILLLLGPALALFLAAGCASTTHRAYDGPSRSPSEIATIVPTTIEYEKGFWRPGKRIHPRFGLMAVDGRAIQGWGDMTVEVLPGPHTGVVGCILERRGNYIRYSRTGVPVSFHAQAGHRYRVDGRVTLELGDPLVFVPTITEAPPDAK